MVEGILVDRGLERMKRNYRKYQWDIKLELKEWPWPYRFAIVFSFDCEGTYGGGKTIKGETEVVPRIANFLAKNNLKGTFNFVGKIAEEFPEIVKQVYELGHDVAGHGYSHVFLDGLSESKQREEIEKTIDAIENACGYRIMGWRTPYLTYDKVTFDILEDLNFKWDNSWSRSLWGKNPFEPILEEKHYKIVEIPVDDVHYDTGLYRWNSPPEEIKHLWINHIGVTAKEYSLYVFLNHPVTMAMDIKRVKIVENLIKFAKLLRDAWITTCRDIANRFMALKNVDFIANKVSHKKDEIEINIILSNKNNFDIENLQILIKNLSSKAEILEMPSENLVTYSNEELGRKDVGIKINLKRNSRRELHFTVKNHESDKE